LEPPSSCCCCCGGGDGSCGIIGFLENKFENPPEKALDMLKLGILWFMNMPRFMGLVEEYIRG